MTTTHPLDRTAAAKTAAMGGLLLVAWGVGTGLLVGLLLVQLLGWLGLPVDTGAGHLLHRAFRP